MLSSPRHTITWDLGLSGAVGSWLVEGVGGGKTLRAVVHKGHGHISCTPSVGGQEVRMYTEDWRLSKVRYGALLRFVV